METTFHSHHLAPQTTAAPLQNNTQPLAVGSTVIYGLHGKCMILAIETKTLNGQPSLFYRLEKVKHPSARPSRPEPAILIPASMAERGGLRASASSEQVEAAINILASPEYYFDFHLPWNKTSALLERTAQQEGYLGLAKVIAYLHGVKLRQVVLSPEIARFSEKASRGFIREMSEAQGTPNREAETLVQKILKNKRFPDA